MCMAAHAVAQVRPSASVSGKLNERYYGSRVYWTRNYLVDRAICHEKCAHAIAIRREINKSAFARFTRGPVPRGIDPIQCSSARFTQPEAGLFDHRRGIRSPFDTMSLPWG